MNRAEIPRRALDRTPERVTRRAAMPSVAAGRSIAAREIDISVPLLHRMAVIRQVARSPRTGLA